MNKVFQTGDAIWFHRDTPWSTMVHHGASNIKEHKWTTGKL